MAAPTPLLATDDPIPGYAGIQGRYDECRAPDGSLRPLWADFLRRRMKRKVVDRDFDRAIEKALQLGRSMDADYLPGWCGPVAED